MARVKFSVTPSDSVIAYWIKVDDQVVNVANSPGTVDLPSGEHLLIWWFYGNPPAKLSIVGISGNKVAVKVKESKIRQGRTRSGGTKWFDV